MTPRITVFPSADGWQVCFHNDESIQELFGTDTLPSGFTVRAEPEYIYGEIRRLNPGCCVRLVRRDGSILEDFDFQDALLYLGRGNIPDQNELSGQSGSASQYALLVVRDRVLDLADPGAFLQTAPYPRLRACI